MRKRFEDQFSFDCTPIDEVSIPTKTRSCMANLMASLQHIYVNGQWNEQICSLLSDKILAGKKQTGRSGMSLWQIFVLAQVRLGLNISYDELTYRANYDWLLRGILGVLPTDFSSGQSFERQVIYDNIKLLSDDELHQINEVIVQIGHGVFKKKAEAGLACKTDSFVVETDTHFPTDYNLLWDSGRKCIDVAVKLNVSGWRKHHNWQAKLKKLMRRVGKASTGGGANKAERVRQAASAYVNKARRLEAKVAETLVSFQSQTSAEAARVEQLMYYRKMLAKHIDLVARRLLAGEQIPHHEKVFSIFQPYTEMIKKGKTNPNVEIGKNLAITTDQYHLIIDWQIAEGQTDNQMTMDIAWRLVANYRLSSWSVDRGFSDKAHKAALADHIDQLIMPKKGRRSRAEVAVESARPFQRLNNAHNAVESNINELEHRGLNRCPDRTRANFDRYIGLAITAYNLCRIGRQLRKQYQGLAEVGRQAA